LEHHDTKGEGVRRFLAGFFCAECLLLFFCFSGEALERIKFFGSEPRHQAFSGVFLGALEESSAGRISGEFFSAEENRNMVSGSRDVPTSEGLELQILSLRDLVTFFPEALPLGTPFLFDSSSGANLFFEESRYFRLLQEPFRQREGAYLLGPAEAGGFLGVAVCTARARALPCMQDLSCAASWEAEAAGLYALGASPVLLSREAGAEAFLRGETEACLLPLEDLDSPDWRGATFGLLLSRLHYELDFLFLSEAAWHALTGEERQLLEEVLKETNRKIRQERQRRIAEILADLENREIFVRRLGLEEQSPFSASARKTYLFWMERTISRNWIDLPLQEAQDANSMIEGQ